MAEPETALAQLVSRDLVDAGHPPLREFIAIRRTPGPSWRNFDEISAAIYDVTRRVVSRVNVESWAERYAIPITRVPGRKGTDEDARAYRAALAAVGITLPDPEPTTPGEPASTSGGALADAILFREAVASTALDGDTHTVEGDTYTVTPGTTEPTA